MQHIFLVGAKSLGTYGGYETFVYKLTEYHQNLSDVKYHVACKANGDGCVDESKLPGVREISDTEFECHRAHCFKIHVPQIGPAQAIYYDVAALEACCRYIKKHQIEHPIVYIMACRIGPFMHHFYEKIHKLGGEVYLNPDGHEWLRQKWAPPIRKYWKLSERLMVRYADLVVCDSVHIEDYILKEYGAYHPKTTYISYGAEIKESPLSDQGSSYTGFLEKHGLSAGNYYLVVCRLVPENNFETIIREFMQSKTEKKLALITNSNGKFFRYLKETLQFEKDPRIVFTGAVYQPDLLQKLREHAYAYLHGHEVGGTNPSLLEGLGATKLNLLLDVSFNREVGQDAAFYWTKEPGSLAACIEQAETLSEEARTEMGRRAKERIRTAYSWPQIARQYEMIWQNRETERGEAHGEKVFDCCG